MDRQFRMVGECFGGEYDGMMIGGNSLPLSITLEADMVTIPRGCSPMWDIERGSYECGPDFIRVCDEWVDIDDLAGTDEYEEMMDMADCSEDEDGTCYVLIHRRYEWTPDSP